MTVKVHLRKGPVHVEWQLDSLEQANTEIFGKIGEEMARIHQQLQDLEAPAPHASWRKRQLRRARRRSTTVEQNHALRCLRYVFTEAKP